MADSLYLKVMGTPGLFWPDGRPVKLKVRKHLALFTYLSLEARSTYRRDELVELLWPARTAKGSQSLSMAFSVFRGFFGPDCVRGNHAIVQFAPPPVLLDLQQLQRGEILGTEIEPPLEVDGVLRDFEIDGAPGFQHWRDRKQAEFFPDVKAGILTFIDQARRSGDTSAMKAFADRLLGLDHLVEEAIETRMEVFAIQGDRFGALRIFEDWRRGLLTELGARPSDRIETLAARLRRRSPQSSALGDAAPIIPPQVERVFVGRAAEYRVLFEAWEAACRGQSSHVLIAGESGIGKSTLALRFGAAASLAGAVMARVQCFELEQRIAYGTIGALVTSLLDQPGAVATDPASLAEVARIVPRVRERFPNLPAPRPVEGEAVRLHFAEGTFALFDAIMEDQPLLLIVDDYPRADEASLSVLHMLLRRSVSGSLMVVLAGRPPEPDEPAQAGRIRKAVSYLPLRKVELGPLTDGECEELMRAALRGARREPGAPERRAIIRSAAGNPMALELLTQDWLAHPDQALAMVLTSMRSDVPRTALEAVEYDQLIDRILPELTSRHRLALYFAAILGPRLNDIDYFDILDFTHAQTMAAISELLELRLLRSTEKGLEFTNEVIRARLYLKIPETTRRRLHDRVATALLKADSCGEPIPGLEIAWHCIRALRAHEATPHLLRAARDAITHGAPDEAARALSSAISHLRGSERMEAILVLAETFQEMAAWQDALAQLRQLKQHDLEEQMKESVETLEIESRWRLGLYDSNELHSVVRRLIRIVQTGAAVFTRVRAALSAAGIAGELKSPQLCRELRELLELLHSEDLDTFQRSKVCVAEAMAFYQARDGDRGFQRALTAARLCEEVGATDSTYVSIQLGLGAISGVLGEYAEAIPHLERAYRCASRLDNTCLMTQIANNLAMCHYQTGPQEQFRRWAEIAREHSAGTPPGSYDRVLGAASSCFARIDNREIEKAMEALAALEEEARRTQSLWIRQGALLYLADAYYLLQDEVASFAAVRRAREVSRSAIAIGFAGRLARWTTVLFLREGRLKEALEELKKYYDILDRLDLVDQAEVLCSLVLLSRRHPIHVPEAASRAREVLALLPRHSSNRLANLGMPLITR